MSRTRGHTRSRRWWTDRLECEMFHARRDSHLARELERAVSEAEDVPDGDYTGERERIRAVWESKSVHHRGRRRSARVRIAEAAERGLWRRLQEAISEYAELTAKIEKWTAVPWV